MKDKDTILLEEAYEKIYENNTIQNILFNLDGWGKSDVYNGNEINNEMIGSFEVGDDFLLYYNSNFSEMDEWEMAYKSILQQLSNENIKFETYEDEYSKGVKVPISENIDRFLEIIKKLLPI